MLSCEGTVGEDGPAGPQGDPGEQGEPGEAAERLIHRAFFSSESDVDDGVLEDRELVFDKEFDDSLIRVTYVDSFSAQSGSANPACGCRWTVTVNGGACSDPGNIVGDVVSIVEQTLVSGSVEGYCAGNSLGSLPTGTTTIGVRVGETPNAPGCDCLTGFGGYQGFIEAEELY